MRVFKMIDQPILKVENLYKHFPVSHNILRQLLSKQRRVVHAVDGVSFEKMASRTPRTIVHL